MKLWKVLALGALLASGSASAQGQQAQCVTGFGGAGITAGSCYGLGVTLLDQNGNPYTASGTGGGAGGGAVYGPDAAGAAPTKPPVLNGTLDGTGNVRSVSPTNPLPGQLYGTLPAFAATPTFNLGTLNGAALDTSVQAVKTALGTPFQAGGSIGNTSFGISGTLPAFATTPTFNIGTAPTLTVQLAAGTNAIGSITNTSFASTIANGADVALGNVTDGASCASGNSHLACERQLHADLLAPTPAGTAVIGKVGIDQTTPGTTNKVSIGTDGTVTANQGGAPWATNQTQLAGAALGAPSAYGTAPTGNVPGVNANVTASALPAGAATAANQNVTTAGTSATSAQAVQGVTNGVQMAVREDGSATPGTVTTSTVQNSSGVTFKGAAGNAYAVNVIAGGTAGFIVLIDAAAVPSSGAAITPKWSMPLAVNTGFSGAPTGTVLPVPCSTGVTLLFSSALATYTPVSAALLGTTVK